MFAALDTSGVAVINADDRFAAFWHGLARAAGTVITFGMRERADISASRVVARQSTSGFVTEFDLRTLQGDCRVALPLAGEHNVMNALAAAAAATGAGADLGAVQKGLQSMRPVAGRLETKAALNGARLIDDSYNANPGSVRAGLRALAELPGERWLVLGEMARARRGHLAPARRDRRVRATDRRLAPAMRSAARRATRSKRSGPAPVVRERRRNGRGREARPEAGPDGPGQGLARQPARAGRRRRWPLTAGSRRREATEMLHYLAEWLTGFYSGFHVFNYLTLRSILAALTALTISLRGRPDDDPQARGAPGRPARAFRRPADRT